MKVLSHSALLSEVNEEVGFLAVFWEYPVRI